MQTFRSGREREIEVDPNLRVGRRVPIGQPKEWWRSKTLWFNVAYLLLVVIGAVLDFFGYGQFEPSGEIVVLGTVLVAAVNLILRYFFTSQALR